jgi:hypothetical protein
MSFFDNLAAVMGGEDQITPEFRAMYSEYQALTAPVTAQSMEAAPTMGGVPTTQPDVNPFEVRGGPFGLIREFEYPDADNGFLPANPNTITTGEGGGLYGGNVNYNPSDSAYGNINPSNYLADKKKGASNLNAAVQRAQYQDYLNRFAPVEDYLVGQVNGRNTQDLGYDVARANQSVANTGLNLQGQQERAMGRFGLATRAPSIAASNEITGGQVAAMNQARIADEARALQLVSGSGNQAGG